MNDRPTDIQTQGKLHPGALGDPKELVANLQGDEARKIHMLGSIIGMIDGISVRSNPNDETKPSIGFKGIFEGIPVDPSKPLIRAPLLFLPESITAIVAKALLGDKPMPTERPQRGKPIDAVTADQMEVGLEIGVKKTNTPIGYEYVIKTAQEMTKVDPLADLRTRLAGRVGVPQLPAPKSEQGGKRR